MSQANDHIVTIHQRFLQCHCKSLCNGWVAPETERKRERETKSDTNVSEKKGSLKSINYRPQGGNQYLYG